MPAGDYWAGLAFFAVTFGSCLGAAWLVVQRRLPDLDGSVRVVAWGLLATAALLVAHLVPGALSLLTREAASAAALVLLGAAFAVPRVPRLAPVTFPASPRPAVAIDRWLAAFGVLAFGIWIALVALKQLYAEPLGFDATSAYLPTAAHWIQEGSLWGITDWVPGFFFGATPGNGTVILLAALLPWDNDFAAHFAMYPFVALTALAIYALAREATAPPPAAALLGVMLTAAPVVVYPGLRDALLDPVLYSAFAAGLLFLLRHHRTDETSDLLLAGLALGIAFGAKFYGFTAVPIVVTVWAIARFWSLVPAATVARQAAILIAPVAVFGAFWVARNWVETGNPAYPVQVEVAGVEIFDAPEDPSRARLGATLADYFDEPGVWTGELSHQFRIAVGIPLILLGIAVIIAIALLIRRRRAAEDDETDGQAVAGLVLCGTLALSYAITPYSATGEPGDPFIAAANVRYGIPALIVAAAVVAWASGRLGRRGLTAFCGLAVIGLFDALRIGVLTPRSTVYSAFVLAAVALAVAWLVRRSRSSLALPRPTRPVVLAAALAGALAVGLLGARIEDTYNHTRYRGKDQVLSALATAADPVRVGLAGNWSPDEPAPIYPAFGTRLQNEVEFVGGVTDGLLRRFGSREEFTAALDRLGPDVLLVGLAGPTPEDPASLRAGDGEPPLELTWARRAGYSDIVASDRFVLMESG